MNQQPTYNPLELLRRWVRGETPYEEERQLEQLAEEDPFLAEALQGYRRWPEGRHGEQVEQLKGRLRERSQRRRGLLSYLPRAAAAVVALALVAGGFWYINQGEAGMPELAVEQSQAKVEQRAEERPVADTSRSIPEGTDTGALSLQQEESGREKGRAVPGNPEGAKKQAAREMPEAKDAAPQESPQIALDQTLPALPETQGAAPAAVEGHLADTDDKKVAAAKREKEINDLTARAKPAPPQAAFTQPSSGKREVSGYVFDAGGEPLIGVSVVQKGAKQGTVTNADGRFSLEMPEGGALIFSYTGYATQERSPGQEDSLEVVLSENALALDEVVVTGLSAPRREAPPPPRPEEGFNKMRKYIRQNLKYPDAARENGIKGAVLLEFRIQADGRPGEIRVRESLGYGCDEEAIRLLKEGPRWEGAGQEATFSVSFK